MSEEGDEAGDEAGDEVVGSEAGGEKTYGKSTIKPAVGAGSGVLPDGIDASNMLPAGSRRSRKPTGKRLIDEMYEDKTVQKLMLEGVDEAEVTSEWAGYRPCTPDGLPALGGVAEHPGLFVGTGHAMMGMTLGPGSGRLLAETILGETPSYHSNMLSPTRF